MDKIPMAGDAGQQPEPDAPSQAKVDYDEGVRQFQLGNLSQAAHALHNARIAYEEAGDRAGIANANFRLGEVCAEAGEHDKALEYYAVAQRICQEEDDLMSLLTLKKRRITSLRALQRYDEAIALHRELLDTYETFNNPAGTVETMVELAETFQAMGDTERAATALEGAAAVHRNFKHTRAAAELEERAAALRATAA